MERGIDMVTRPRNLEDTIADLMCGNLSSEAVRHAVAELKRLRDIRQNIVLLTATKTVSDAIPGTMKRGEFASFIAGRLDL